ncbi:MAG: hypothetical protein AB1505_06340 [Candidatus Latescibacterota bacterium]
MEGGLKRLGALFLKCWAVPMVPLGAGLMLYGILHQLRQPHELDVFSVGVSLTVFGALLWVLARRLDAAASLVRYRRRQTRLVRLARDRGGRLTVTEAAAETGLTVEESEDILKALADRGYVELQVTDSGMVVYRFPELLLAHEKHWSRGVESV